MLTDKEALVALNALPQIGPVRTRRMLRFFGSPQAILSANLNQLQQIEGVGQKMASVIKNWENLVDVQQEITEAKQRGIKIITQLDPLYPSNLKNIYDPPLLLYVWGDLLETDKGGISIVGSRKHSYYGQQCAQRLSYALAYAGMTVISGLARGIDTYAHEGALAAKGRTIAVIGSGLTEIYPPENFALAERIADGNGAVVSEFRLGQKPDKRNFPIRNRVVAGWSDGVLVVECPKWSGSLITANLAVDQGKQIYAVPGQIDSPTSGGCNELIRNGATLVTGAEDILQDRLSLPSSNASKNQEIGINPALLNLPENEQKIYDCLSSHPQIMDFILEETQLTLPEISICLIQLEVKKLVEQLPGQRYVKT